MDIWNELFGTIGWWVLPFMIAVWAVRERWEIWKSRGQAQKSLDQAQALRLAEILAGQIQEFHKELTKTEGLLNDLYYLYMPVGIAPPKVDPVTAVQQMRNLQSMAERQQIYFKPTLRVVINSMCEALADLAQILERREMLIRSGRRGTEEESDLEKTAFHTLKDIVPDIRAKLDEEFRHILGTK